MNCLGIDEFRIEVYKIRRERVELTIADLSVSELTVLSSYGINQLKDNEYNCELCNHNATKQELTVTLCGHFFHSKCILNHLIESDKFVCPICDTAV